MSDDTRRDTVRMRKQVMAERGLACPLEGNHVGLLPGTQCALCNCKYEDRNL